MKRFPKCRHAATRENTYMDPSKGPQCRKCKRAYQAEYMRRRRAVEPSYGQGRLR